MIDMLFEGIILGILISITIGPAFFTIVQTGIHRGFSAGLIMAIGISLSDIALITISYLGASIVLSNPENKLYIGLIGGVVLIIFGIVTFRRKPEILLRRSSKNKTPLKTPGPLTFFFKGFFMNILNPFLLLFWLTVMSWVTAKAEPGKLLNYAIPFFSAVVGTVFCFDLLKSFIANKIKNYLKPRNLLWINRIVGISLIIFGIILIVKVIFFK
ncbi:MAG: LysE family transporter [Bacteroidetes bacterium]|nr:LysE family transporter [Bacteroidota bacterium]